jgi:hypothetical protein
MADPPSGDPGGRPTSSHGAVSLSPPKGSPPNPEFRRITTAYKRQRNGTASFTEANRAPSFEFSGGGEERGTNLDEVAWLIANLKETIIQQNNIIENVKTDLTEIKSEQQTLKTRMPNYRRRSGPSGRNLAPTQGRSHQAGHGRR